MGIFLFDKKQRENSENFIDFGFWWDDEPSHKFVTTIEEKGIISYYLFNFIKIGQTKI